MRFCVRVRNRASEYCCTRAGPNSHKHKAFGRLSRLSDEQLDDLLATGLSEDEWILPEAYVHDEEGPDHSEEPAADATSQDPSESD